MRDMIVLYDLKVPLYFHVDTYTPSRNAFNCAIKQDSYSNCHDSFLLSSPPHNDPSIPPRSLEISSTSYSALV